MPDGRAPASKPETSQLQLLRCTERQNYHRHCYFNLHRYKSHHNQHQIIAAAGLSIFYDSGDPQKDKSKIMISTLKHSYKANLTLLLRTTNSSTARPLWSTTITEKVRLNAKDLHCEQGVEAHPRGDDDHNHLSFYHGQPLPSQRLDCNHAID